MNQLTVKVLLACFFTAVFFLFNLFYKSSNNGISFIDSFISKKNTDALSVTKINEEIHKTILISPTLEKANKSLANCVVYGPISPDNKTVVDMLLTKANITGLFNIVEKPVYEVYWNLGKDKLTAIELFEVQKNEGPLQDEKYKLALNANNDWIVSISQIIADENMAKNLSTNLSSTANKIKTGGAWEYKNNTNVYFYQSNNSAKVPYELSAVLEKTFSINKSTCV